MYEFLIIDEENAAAFRPLIREDAYPFIINNGVLALGIVDDFFAVAALVCQLDGEGAAQILSIFVAKEHRRKGLATELLSTAADILIQEGEISRFVCDYTDNGEEEAFTGLLRYLEFDIKEGAEGCYLTTFGQLRGVNALKGEGKKCIEYKDLDKNQRALLTNEEMDLTLYEGEGEIESNMSCVIYDDKEKKLDGCLIFTKEESGDLVLSWARGSNRNSTVILQMLRHAVSAGSAYDDGQKIYIPVINEKSAELAEKLLEGASERIERSYTAELEL